MTLMSPADQVRYFEGGVQHDTLVDCIWDVLCQCTTHGPNGKYAKEIIDRAIGCLPTSTGDELHDSDPEVARLLVGPLQAELERVRNTVSIKHYEKIVDLALDRGRRIKELKMQVATLTLKGP